MSVSSSLSFHTPHRNRRTKHVIYIATIEKANGLVNSLVEMERISSLGLVVVDEVCVRMCMYNECACVSLYTSIMYTFILACV